MPDQYSVPDHPTSGYARWQQWADRISSAWQKAVVAIVETGRLLIEAKDDPDLPHGTFEAMVQSKLPFTPRTAQMLMAIARHPVISNANHGSLLPPSWHTLYELTKLPPPLLVAKIKDGTITPKLERKDVAKLRDEEEEHRDQRLTVNGQPVEPKPPPASLKALREENSRLREENGRLKERLDGEHLFDPTKCNDNEIVDALIGRLAGWRDRAEHVFRLGLKKIEERKKSANTSKQPPDLLRRVAP